MINNEKIAKRRDYVLSSYNAACKKNDYLFSNGDYRATKEYIFDNQKEDALKILNTFYKKKTIRVTSIQKKTKVGADGLMIEIAKLLTTHNDDEFVVDPDNVRIITGMSNVSWEQDMKEKTPECFKDKIFHHGKEKGAADSGLNQAQKAYMTQLTERISKQFSIYIYM